MMMQRKYVIYFTIVIVISGLCCALAAMVAGIGNRFGWWDFHTGIRFLKWAAYGEALAIPASMWMIAHRAPPIHDITTDTENPPKFVAIVKLRKDASNPVEYGGQQVAKLQRMAYPDIGPLIIDDSPARAFELAFETAQKMGWEIANADTDNGLIEATATTFWFGFKDDVAIRITAQEHGSRIDVRSVSRVGISDIGTNAKRIRTFVKLLKNIQSSHF